MICTWLCPGHLSVHVWNSLQCSEEILKILNDTFQCIIIVIIIIGGPFLHPPPGHLPGWGWSPCYWVHGWEIAVILWNLRKNKLSKSKFLFFLFFLKLYFNIHTMCNSTTFALRHTQISLFGILRHFQPPSRHLLLNTHDTNMEFLQLSGPLLDIFLFFSKTKMFHSHPCE